MSSGSGRRWQHRAMRCCCRFSMLRSKVRGRWDEQRNENKAKQEPEAGNTREPSQHPLKQSKRRAEQRRAESILSFPLRRLFFGFFPPSLSAHSCACWRAFLWSGNAALALFKSIQICHGLLRLVQLSPCREHCGCRWCGTGPAQTRKRSKCAVACRPRHEAC